MKTGRNNNEFTVVCDSDTLELKPVSLHDIPAITEYLQRYPSRSCDFSIGGILMWSDYFKYRIGFAKDSLIISGAMPESRTLLFYAPVGPIDRGSFRKLVADYCASHGEEGIILSASDISADESRESSIENPLVDDWKEYIYDADKFISFSGRKMEKKRNHYNFFLNHYPEHTIEAIDNSNIAEIIAFTKEFDKRHEGNSLSEYENEQTIRVLEDFGRYPFLGIAVRYEGKIIGYSFGECIGDTFFCHVEKGDIEYRGIYQMLASAMCRAAMSAYDGIRYLNREEDMGEESLRRSKLSYHPSRFIIKSIQCLQ